MWSRQVHWASLVALVTWCSSHISAWCPGVHSLPHPLAPSRGLRGKSLRPRTLRCGILLEGCARHFAVGPMFLRSLSGPEVRVYESNKGEAKESKFPEQTEASGREPERTREKESSRAERGQREARPGGQRTVRVRESKAIMEQRNKKEWGQEGNKCI